MVGDKLVANFFTWAFWPRSPANRPIAMTISLAAKQLLASTWSIDVERPRLATSTSSPPFSTPDAAAPRPL